MTKLSIEVSEEVLAAITEEGQREYRSVAQQASYLLLTWTREQAEKRQKDAKAAGKTPPLDQRPGQANGSPALQPLG